MNETFVKECAVAETVTHQDVTKLGTFTVAALACGVTTSILKAKLGKYLELPFTLIVFMLGMSLGAVHASTSKGLGSLSHSIEEWKGLEPEILLFIFIPPLLFTSAFEVEYHIFRRLMGQAVLLATLGVVICAALLACVAVGWFDYGWGWAEGFLFGGMFGATDPVAVVALLHELGAPETLSVLIEGESLLNDGVGFVLFSVFFENLSGRAVYTVGEIFLKVLTSSFFGMLVGVGLGILGLLAIQQVWDDTIVAVGISVVVVFATFLVSEALHVSGVIAVVFLGLVFAAYEDGYIKHEVSLSLKRFWKKIEYCVNTVLFAFSGIVIMDVLVKADQTYKMTGRDILNLILLFIAINVIRLISVIMLYYPLAKTGYGFSWRRCLVVSYSGLRGAIGLIAALLVVNECSCDGERQEDEVCLPVATQNQMVFHMAGIVLLTLAINGTTTKYLVNYFGMNKKSIAAKSFFEKATVHVHEHMDYVIESLKRHPHYKNADWDLVWKHLPILSHQVYQERKRMGVPHMRETFTLLRQIEKISKDRFTEECKVVPPGPGDIEDDLSSAESEDVDPVLQVNEARHRFLALVKASYRRQFNEGANHSWPELQVLIEAASRCQDRVDRPLDEWDGHIKSYVTAQRNVFLLSICSPNAVAARLANSYNVAASFVRAHKSVASQFRSLSHEANNAVVQQILDENSAMVDEAVLFTESIEREYPEIASAVKTNVAIQRLLKEMESYANKMLDRAEIDEKDLETISHALEESRKDLRALRTHAQVDKLQILRNCSIMLDVSEEVIDMLTALSVPASFSSGEVILKPGERAEKLMLIVKGKVMIKFPNGSDVERTAGDVLGTLEFTTENPCTYTATCVTNVEVMCLTFRVLNEVVTVSEEMEHNISREAGLLLLESMYPQFQFATFNLLKAVLPHVKVLTGQRGQQSMHSSTNRNSVSRRHRSVVSMSRPLAFHGGIIIVLRGSVTETGSRRVVPPLTAYQPETPLLLGADSVIVHVNADAVARIEDYNAFDADNRVQRLYSNPITALRRQTSNGPQALIPNPSRSQRASRASGSSISIDSFHSRDTEDIL